MEISLNYMLPYMELSVVIAASYPQIVCAFVLCAVGDGVIADDSGDDKPPNSLAQPMACCQ